MPNFDQNDIVPWFFSVLITGIGALATAIAVLWKVNESKNSRAIRELERRFDATVEDLSTRLAVSDRKHEECLRDRNDWKVRHAVLTESYRKLERDLIEIKAQRDSAMIRADAEERKP